MNSADLDRFVNMLITKGLLTQQEVDAASQTGGQQHVEKLMLERAKLDKSVLEKVASSIMKGGKPA